MREFNFIQNILESDKELFFGPLVPGDPNDEFIEIQPHWNMANIVAATGIFSSTNQARKNGFDKDIPNGYTDMYIGKLKKRITILNISC
jgi:hypothetical protein